MERSLLTIVENKVGLARISSFLTSSSFDLPTGYFLANVNFFLGSAASFSLEMQSFKFSRD
jgi:hypothetical protein